MGAKDNRKFRGVIILNDGTNPVPITGTINVGDSNTPPQSNNIATYVTAGKVFSWSGNANLASSNTDNPLFLLRNPLGSGKNIYIHKVYAGDTVTNVAVIFKLWHSPTITGTGSIQVIENNFIGHPTTSVSSGYLFPTVSSTGSELRNQNNGQNNNSCIISEDSSILLPPGKDLLLTGSPSSNNRNSALTIVWIEL